MNDCYLLGVLKPRVTNYLQQNPCCRLLKKDADFKIWSTRTTNHQLLFANSTERWQRENDLNFEIDEISKRWPDYDWQRALFAPGEYYPRIWRGLDGVPIEPHKPPESMTVEELATDVYLSPKKTNIVLFKRLLDWLAEITHTVEPVPQNLMVFGHEIRLLLLTACTEVESQWAGILRAHRYEQQTCRKQRTWSTNDYVKLFHPLQLNRWHIDFPGIPSNSMIAPFHGWDAERPTQTLPWYSAYNETKHDRETKLEEATLKMAIEAVAAAGIMVAAQFGPKSLDGLASHELGLEIAPPKWRCTEQYWGPDAEHNWRPMFLPFSSNET